MQRNNLQCDQTKVKVGDLREILVVTTFSYVGSPNQMKINVDSAYNSTITQRCKYFSYWQFQGLEKERRKKKWCKTPVKISWSERVQR